MDRLDFDFGGIQLKFLRCDCGNETTKVPCWDCNQKELERLETRQKMAARGFPARYDWADGDTKELRARAMVPLTPDSITGAIAALRASTDALLVGPAGCGKTSLAISMAKTRGTNVRFIRADALAAASRESALGFTPPLIEHAQRVGLLVLDDLGCEHASMSADITRVIGHRHDESRPVWITTGLGYKEIVDRYGSGIARRVAKHEAVTLIRWTKGER